MDATEAVVLLRSYALGVEDEKIAEAISVLSDHVLRLEQGLHLIKSATTGAFADMPANAILGYRSGKKTKL